MSQDGPPTSGIKFGNYAVVANEDGTPFLLGGGAYGKTYKAVHSFLGTTVALKVIHDSFAFDAGVKKRFLGEARAIAQLKHPHIAQVIDCGEDDGTLYYAMEYCDGGDLDKLVTARGALSDETVLLLAKQAAKALAYVHDQKFLHRDLKPSNLMLSMVTGRDEANLKVIDFGLVKALGQDNAVGMTQTGQFLGTLLYASPEQLREEDLDERTDVFSLGLTLWFLLEGGLPLKGRPAQVVAQRLSGTGYDELLPKESHQVVRSLLSSMLHPVKEKRMADMHAVLTGITESLAQIHGTGQILLEGKGHKSGQVPKLANTASTVPRISLVTSNQRVSSQFEVGEEDKELQTDLGVRCRGRWMPKGDPVHLTIVRKALAADSSIVQQLDDLVSKASVSDGPFLIRPQALVQFTDQLVLAEEYVEGLSLLNVLRARRQLSLADASPILRQLAEACDLAQRAGINTLELVAHRVLFQFPRQSIAGMTGGGVERLITRPISQWPSYLLRVAPAYTEAQRSGNSHLTGIGAPSFQGGATMVANADDDADSPSRFARLTYRILSGHPVPVAAMMSQSAYVSISGLSEEGNRLLAGIIARETPISDCLSLLQQIWRVESMPEMGLALPMPAEQLTNLRAASPTEPPFVPPVQAATNTQDMVILDPFTNSRPAAQPARPAAPRPQATSAPASRPPTSAMAPQRPQEPSPQARGASAKPQVTPLGRSPASAPPQQPAPNQNQAWVAPQTAQPRPQTQIPAPPPAERQRTAPPQAEQQAWTRPPSATPQRPAQTSSPARQEAPRHVPPPRSPHLPPPPERKPLPVKMILGGGAATIVLVGMVWGVMQFFKPDALQTAITKAAGKPDVLAEELRPLWVNRNIRIEQIEEEVKKLESNGSASARDVFTALHNFYINERLTREADALIDTFKAKDVPEAWAAFVKNAEGSNNTAQLIEGRLHIAAESGDKASRDWLKEQDTKDFTRAQAAPAVEQFKRSLNESSPDEKKKLLPKIAALIDMASGASPKGDWDIYGLFKENTLASEPEAIKRLESAASGKIPEAENAWLDHLTKTDPGKALQAHLKLAQGRPDSLKEIANRFIASTSATEQQDILKTLSPLVAKLPLDVQPQVTRKLAEVEIAKVPQITWLAKRQIYLKYQLKEDAQKELYAAAEKGDLDAITLKQDEDIAKNPAMQWQVYPERAGNPGHKLSGDAFQWILDQKDTDILAHAAVVTPLLEKKLPSKGSTLDITGQAIVRKLGSLHAAQWGAKPGSTPGLFELYAFYRDYALTPETTDTLKKAKDAGIEPAMLEWATLQTDDSAKLAAYADHAQKFPTKVAVPQILKLLGTTQQLPANNVQRAVTILETELKRPEATVKKDIVATLKTILDADKSLAAAQKTLKLRDYYTWSGDKSAINQMEMQQRQAEFDTAVASYAAPEKRKDALTELYRLTDVPAVSQQAQQWLQKNVEAKLGNANFEVIDPLDETKTLPVPWQQWKASNPVSTANPRRFFTLPAVLPPVMASSQGSVKPTTSKDGKIISPYGGIPVAVARSSWFPGADVPDPDAHQNFRLPNDLELLVATFGESKGDPVLKNPFDNELISLAEWKTTNDWSRWQSKSLEIVLAGPPPRKFLLPDLDDVPALKRAVTLDKCDPVKLELLSPFTGMPVTFSVTEWRDGDALADPTMKALGLKATIELPSDRPKLVAKLNGKPFEVVDPYTNEDVTVHWSEWKPGQDVTELTNSSSKKSTKGKSEAKVLFKLPPDLGPLADPQLQGTTPNRIAHTVVSPYGGHKVTVGQEAWKPGGTIKDSEYAHLSIKLPTDLGGEWFELKEGTPVEGSYSKVRSPYGDKPTVSVGRENWESGKAKEDSGDELPFLMPKISDPKLEAKVVSAFAFKAKNPYTGESETWGESGWRDGATKTWAGPLSYHLPSPVEKFEVKTATYQGDRVVQSPYPGGGSKTLTWNQLAAGGTITDSEGRPMRMPSVPDPRLPAKATKQNGKVTLINPYTGSGMTVSSNIDRGDSIPSGIGGFTIKIADLTVSILKKRIVLQNLMFDLDPNTLWYLGTKGQVMSGGNSRDLEVKLNSDRNARGLPSDYRFFYDADNRRMIAKPKD